MTVSRRLQGALAGLLLAAAPAAAENRALIVGVGTYQDPRANLPGIDKDVENARQVALLLGFTEKQIKLLRDSNATLDGIRGSLQNWLIEGVQDGDRALFYFTGHGSYIPDTNGDEEDGVDEVLLPYDVRIVPGNLQQALVDDELGRLLDRVPTSRVFVMLDACHSGTATRSLGGGPFVSKFFRYDGMPTPAPAVGAAKGIDALRAGAAENNRVVLTAATEREEARATKDGSVFTVGVLRALSGAASRHEAITPEQIREAATKSVAAQLSSRPAIIHHPQVYGSPSLVAANVFDAGAGPPSAPVTPAAPPQTTARPAPAAPPPPPPTTARPAPAAPPPPPPTTARPAPAAPPPPPPTTAAAPVVDASNPWSQLEDMAKRARDKVEFSMSQPSYRVNENLVIDVKVPSDGYLNVISIGEGDAAATVLFPNAVQRDNAVKAGQRFTIPGRDAGFALPAGLPDGVSEQRTLVVVLHTRQKVDAFESGFGDGLIRTLSGGATRSFSVVATKPAAGAYGAGQAVVVIRR